jgi:hypothetical protein
MPSRLVASAEPVSHFFTASVVMPQSMIVKGSAIISGGVFSAGCGGADCSAAMAALRRLISAGQCVGPRRARTDIPSHPEDKERVAHLAAVEIDHVVRMLPETRPVEQRRQFPHLPPRH